MRATARFGEKEYRSKLEAQYALSLESFLQSGLIKSWRYEPITLKIATGSRYTPDFMVIDSTGAIELVEVKGWHRNIDASREKWKAAAAINPWARFTWATRSKDGGSWVHEHYD